MKQETFNTFAGTVFGVIAFLHVLRILFRWNASIGGWTVPLWASWLALLLAGYLAYSAFTLKKQ